MPNKPILTKRRRKELSDRRVWEIMSCWAGFYAGFGALIFAGFLFVNIRSPGDWSWLVGEFREWSLEGIIFSISLNPLWFWVGVLVHAAAAYAYWAIANRRRVIYWHLCPIVWSVMLIGYNGTVFASIAISRGPEHLFGFVVAAFWIFCILCFVCFPSLMSVFALIYAIKLPRENELDLPPEPLEDVLARKATLAGEDAGDTPDEAVVKRFGQSEVDQSS